MALVATQPVMEDSQAKLMMRGRIQLPPLPFDTTTHRQSHTPLAVDSPKASLKRKQPFEPEPQYAPRFPRRTFNFSSDSTSDMETYHGHVRTPADAIVLFEACRIGLLPRVQRRLSEKERQSIKSGSVFVWDEREAGMRRWTDGKSWSASRVSGSFLTYREMEGKRGGGGSGYPPPVTALSRAGRTPDSTHGSESDIDIAGEEGPDGYRYKPDGLVKQSFSITTSAGNHLHLISYFSRANPASQQLNCPSSDPQLRHIRPQKGMYPESTVHEHQNIPAVTRSPMAGAPYTTTPQMAGYARQGPPQWPQQQGYGWSQPPPPHPQYQYYGYGYSPNSNGAPPPPPNTAQSPLQYSQSAQYPASQTPDRTHPGYDHRGPPPHPEYQGYDSRRFPPTPPDSRPQQNQQPNTNSPDTRPHPPPQYQHSGSYSAGVRENYPGPPYDQRYQRPSQTSEHPSPAMHSQAPQANGTQHPNSQTQPYPPGPLPPPQPARSTPPSQYQHHQPPNSTSTPIDPQLMGAGSSTHHRSGPANEPAPSAQIVPRNDSQSRAPAQANGYHPSSASYIPSINALVNGSAPQSQTTHQIPTRANGPVSNGLSSYLQKTETKSPSEASKGKDGPQDIPSSKAGLTEDKRAINMLDRGFRV